VSSAFRITDVFIRQRSFESVLVGKNRCLAAS